MTFDSQHNMLANVFIFYHSSEALWKIAILHPIGTEMTEIGQILLFKI